MIAIMPPKEEAAKLRNVAVPRARSVGASGCRAHIRPNQLSGTNRRQAAIPDREHGDSERSGSGLNRRRWIRGSERDAGAAQRIGATRDLNKSIRTGSTTKM